MQLHSACAAYQVKGTTMHGNDAKWKAMGGGQDKTIMSALMTIANDYSNRIYCFVFNMILFFKRIHWQNRTAFEKGRRKERPTRQENRHRASFLIGKWQSKTPDIISLFV